VPGAKLYLLCATLLYGVFSIFFENLYFFGTPMAQNKPFFLYKIKSSEKQKCENINYFHPNLKFFKD